METAVKKSKRRLKSSSKKESSAGGLFSDGDHEGFSNTFIFLSRCFVVDIVHLPPENKSTWTFTHSKLSIVAEMLNQISL